MSRLGRRQFRRLKSTGFVRAVAKGFDLRLSASAQGDILLAGGDRELITLMIDNLDGGGGNDEGAVFTAADDDGFHTPMLLHGVPFFHRIRREPAC